MHQRAASDELTGLLNRRGLLEQLEALLSQPDRRRSDEGLALLFCDLDLFKEINDTLGHSVGDTMLRTTAQQICRCLRSGDLAARMGGDELVVVLRDIPKLDTAVVIAEKIRLAIAQPISTVELQVNLTASIGVTMARPQEGVDELMARADQGMYQAKQAGRNCMTRIIGAAPPVGHLGMAPIDGKRRRARSVIGCSLHDSRDGAWPLLPT